MIDLERLRRDMLEIIDGEIAAGAIEEGQPPQGNEGPFVEKYLNGGQPAGVIKYRNLAFCVGGYQWVLKQALTRQGLKLPWHYTLEASKLAIFFRERSMGTHAGLWLADEGYSPKPGDAVFTAKKGSNSIHHVTMVKLMKGDSLTTIGANEYDFEPPSRPAWHVYDRGTLPFKRLHSFGSLDCLANL
jgi:hypothetical protein